MNMKKTILAVAFIFFALGGLKSQFNIRVGYAFAYTEADGLNVIMRKYNDANPWLENKFDEFHYFNGLELGVRYKFGNLGFDLSFNNLSKSSEGQGNNPTTGSYFKDKWNASLIDYSLGIETYYGNIGIGTALCSTRFKVTTDISNSKNDKVVMKSNQYSSRFYLIFSLPTRSTAVALKPFVEIPWNNFNFSAVNQEIFGSGVDNDPAYDAKMMFFGISALFYNGPN